MNSDIETTSDRAGVTTAEEFEQLIKELHTFTEDETTLFAFPCMAQVWARKD